jgi:hypothetical protein
MNYDEMTNEELQKLLLKRLLGPQFSEVNEGNRQTVIAILKIGEDEETEDEDKGR